MEAGINFVVFSIIAYLIYGYKPQVGASAERACRFYAGRFSYGGFSNRRRCLPAWRGPQPPVVGGAADRANLGRMRAKRLGRGGRTASRAAVLGGALSSAPHNGERRAGLSAYRTPALRKSREQIGN